MKIIGFNELFNNCTKNQLLIILVHLFGLISGSISEFNELFLPDDFCSLGKSIGFLTHAKIIFYHVSNGLRIFGFIVAFWARFPIIIFSINI